MTERKNDHKSINERWRTAVEAALDGLFDNASYEGGIYPALRRAMRYSLEAGGKRLRPVLLLAVCELLGGDTDKAMPIACGLEMIHTYSLIHDDLPCMDDDDMRRGRPSNHIVFGEAMAVLAGDGLLSFAFETMLNGCMRIKGDNTGYLKAVNEVAYRAGARGMVTGQAADIEFEGSAEQTEEMLHYIHTHKTADMLCAAVLAGAYVAEADGETVEMLAEYAEKLGLLFQITDDILDLRGDPAVVGKTLGKDAEAHKLTYATLYGLEGALDAAGKAAAEAKAAVAELPNNDYLIATIDNILVRSY